MKGLNYILILYFSIGACFPKSDFSQLANISNLVKHYHVHTEAAALVGESVSLKDFFYIHLIQEDGHEHQEEQSHHNFPLKTLNNSIVLFCNAVWHTIVNPKVVTSIKITTKFPSFFSKMLGNNFISSIFHPPLHYYPF